MPKRGSSFLKGKWSRILFGALGAIGGAGLIGHFTGINNTLVAPALGYVLGGPIVAVAALLLPMLTGSGFNLGSLTGNRNVPANPNVTSAGTVYT